MFLGIREKVRAEPPVMFIKEHTPRVQAPAQRNECSLLIRNLSKIHSHRKELVVFTCYKIYS